MDNIRKGVKLLNDNVIKTFGPLGKNVIIHTLDGELIITKDGVTVANNTNKFEESETQAGIEIVRQAANRTLSMAGDGTSSTVIFASDMILKAELPESFDINKLKTDANNVVSSLLKELKKKVSFKFDLFGIAKTSCNGNTEIARIITDIIDHCGINGHFEYEQSFNIDSFLLNNGYKFNRGYISPMFINNVQSNSCEFSIESNVIIFNEKLEDLKKIASLMTKGKPLLVIAEDFSNGFIQLCIKNFKNGVPIIPVKLPEFGEQRQFFLEDLALYCNTSIAVHEQCDASMVSSIKGFKITQDKTIISEPLSKFEDYKTIIDDRITMIKNQINSTSVDFKIKKLQDRISSLSSKNAILSIYGATDTEFQERKDLYDDGLKACQNALKYGVLPGGGISILKAAIILNNKKFREKEMSLGEALIFNSCFALCDATYKSNKIIGEVISSKFFVTHDLRSNKTADARKLNILDSYKTVESTLINATSVALSILTSDLYINSFRKE
jgi:chaperonin GroEL